MFGKEQPKQKRRMSKEIQLKDRYNEKIYPHPFWPIGSIYMSVNNINPSTYFGGTWDQIAKGRTLVGVDTSQTEFNTVKKTGGAKTNSTSYTPKGSNTATALTINQIPSHSHNVSSLKISSGNGTKSGTFDMVHPTWENSKYFDIETLTQGGGQSHNHSFTGTSSTISISSLQPYLTCYIWQRVS